MRILVADDEAPARERLCALVQEIGAPYLLAGEAANGEQALQQCDAQVIDLVLMDIRMPGIDGIDAAVQLAARPTPPAVIFVTAFEEHALDAFRAQAVDYLLKPIRLSRLQRALQRAAALTRPQLQALQALQQVPEQISVSYRGGVRRIPLQQVIYFRADQKYVVARHSGGEALLEEPLKQLEGRFAGRFLRIHRNALVACRSLIGLERDGDGRHYARLDGVDDRLEISRRHLPEVRRWLKQSGQGTGG